MSYIYSTTCGVRASAFRKFFKKALLLLFTSSRFVLPIIWIVAVGAAGVTLHRFEITPAEKRAATKPKDVSRANTLLLFAHPKCPCTSATLKNLELIHQAHPETQTEIMLVIPAGAPADFEDGPTSSWQASHSWARLSLDPKGALATAAGATTSGHVIYYDANGDTQFSGGITRARAVAGEATALRSLLASIGGSKTSNLSQHDVFGCPLL